ncbi:hypothetical protein TNCV_3764031 [Trichonephila clavipes]|uniref:Uncharacterized protein n=1 Tax=Trichonephila clavipes TaxID=2585209 RepID=A0A8X7B8H4_TRICX|nr:hypothetical protein TNCV_3764031 [Trichonephila clavipes]
MVMKANDRRTSIPCHDEFRGRRSDYVRQVALATTTTGLLAMDLVTSNFGQENLSCHHPSKRLHHANGKTFFCNDKVERASTPLHHLSSVTQNLEVMTRHVTVTTRINVHLKIVCP